MIFGNIKDAERYYSVNSRFKETFEFLAKLSPDALPQSVVEDGFRINLPNGYSDNFDLDTNGAPRQFEAHRDYLDIHYCIAGSEGFGYNDISKLIAATEYDKENDFQLFEGEVFKLVLHPGDFCVVFPEDAHIPQLIGDPDGKVMKVVVKIRL